VINHNVINVLDMIEVIGEERLLSILSDFSCPLNPEVENFVKNNAIEFARKKMSLTYLIVDDDSAIQAIFTLTHKALEINREKLSMSAQRKIQRYAHLDEKDGSYNISAFLIAQFGKNYQPTKNEKISGNILSGISGVGMVQYYSVCS